MEDHQNLAERIKEALQSNFGYLAVLLVSLSYVATAFLTVQSTGKSAARIVADGVLAFLVGLLINRMFEAQGVIHGDADARVRAAVERHAAAVEEASLSLDALDAWCEERNAEALLRARRTFLSRHGLRDSDFFEEDGTPRPPEAYPPTHTRRERIAQRLAVARAREIRITRLSAGLLISDTGEDGDPYFLGRSKREFHAQSMRQDVGSKLALAFLFGYYGVSLLSSFSVATLLWTVLQLAVFLLMGAIRMEQSYLYVVDEYRARISKKTDVLRMFLARGEGQ